MASGTVFICNPAGEQVAIPFSDKDTVRKLKEQLLAKRDAGVAHVMLLNGAEVLQDDWTLVEHGVADGTLLTQVASRLPSGVFGFTSRGTRAPPAGRNTSANVHAVFGQNGQGSATFELTVEEDEITSLTEGPDWDPFAWGAAFDHEYQGTVRLGNDSELILAVAECKRKGRFKGREPSELSGRLCPDDPEAIELQIPFAAGGCNEGTAGLRWLTLKMGQLTRQGERGDCHRPARRGPDLAGAEPHAEQGDGPEPDIPPLNGPAQHCCMLL